MLQASWLRGILGSQVWIPASAQGYNPGSFHSPKRRSNSTFSPPAPDPQAPESPGPSPASFLSLPGLLFPSLLPPSSASMLYVGACVCVCVCVCVRACACVRRWRELSPVLVRVSVPLPTAQVHVVFPVQKPSDSQGRCPPLGCPGCPCLGLAVMGSLGHRGDLWAGIGPPPAGEE